MNMQDHYDSIEHWRNEAGTDNPAGPLFASGEFAEADIAGGDMTYTHAGPTACGDCTGSCTYNCAG